MRVMMLTINMTVIVSTMVDPRGLFAPADAAPLGVRSLN